MRLTSKPRLAAALAAFAFTPVLLVPPAAAPSQPPPALQLAILPGAASVRRQRRYVTLRPWLRRLSRGGLRSRARGLSLRPRRFVRESYARGPPRAA
jgi:hypothetical protein